MIFKRASLSQWSVKPAETDSVIYPTWHRQYWTPLTQSEHWSLYLFDYKLRMKLIPPCVFSFVSLSAACPVSYFKSVSGSVPCSVCPSNSRTSLEGSSMCECRSGFYRAANDANSSACTSELCWFACLRLALWEVFKGPHWSFVIYSDCENRDVQSGTRIHPLFSSLYKRKLIPPAEKNLLCSLKLCHCQTLFYELLSITLLG